LALDSAVTRQIGTVDIEGSAADSGTVEKAAPVAGNTVDVEDNK